MKKFSTFNFQFSILLIGFALILFHWVSDTVKPNNLLYTVKPIYFINFFESRYLYTYAHLFAFIPVFCLSFDKKVAFYKKWRYLLPAILIVATPFWIWDIAKTDRGVWGFNPTYYTHLFLNLPIEEWLFFITFPFASVFIYECLNVYDIRFTIYDLRFLPTHLKSEIQNLKLEKIFTILLITFFFLIGFFYWGHLYTVTTFLACGTVLLWQFLYGDKSVRLKFYLMFPIALIPFILINSIFTGAFTHAPIVVYNPEEYIGIRFFTIPLDDFAYNFLLIFSVIILYEYFRTRKIINSLE